MLGSWCSWLYFPVDEGNKVRACMDPGELNQNTFLQEKCWMPGIDGVVSLLSSLRSHLGDVRLRFAKEDWQHGFRQLVLSVEDRRYLCVVVVSLIPGQRRGPGVGKHLLPQSTRVLNAQGEGFLRRYRRICSNRCHLEQFTQQAHWCSTPEKQICNRFLCPLHQPRCKCSLRRGFGI